MVIADNPEVVDDLSVLQYETHLEMLSDISLIVRHYLVIGDLLNLHVSPVVSCDPRVPVVQSAESAVLRLGVPWIVVFIVALWRMKDI